MICKLREIMGDWALDMKWQGETFTIYFKSRQNALNVKRILEVDDSIPNAATVCDVVEVVRCKNCQYYELLGDAILTDAVRGICTYRPMAYGVKDNDFCSYGERKEG